MAQPHLFALLLLGASVSHAAVTISEPSGLSASVTERGVYFIEVPNTNWSFEGSLPGPLQQIQKAIGSDGIGSYDEIDFGFVDNGTPKQGSIRAYRVKPVVLFTVQYLTAGSNGTSFPSFARHPVNLHGLTNSGWQPHFDAVTTDGPLAEFDGNGQTFIISPASHFTVAVTTTQPALTSGIRSEIGELPNGFTHRTLLVVEEGINQAFDTWGHALTDLQGKTRPANNADITLSKLGYWTDNGADYYYEYDHRVGYQGTLLAIRDEFRAKDVPLGYVQLDSWFYPKGAEADWRDSGAGIFEYEAAAALFQGGLKSFQNKLGLPLMTHSRWIDAASPYRRKYHMSNNVSVDPRYWQSVMSYLSESGVQTYEQDWLATHALTDFNLVDPDLFLDEMAQTAKQQGLTIQYCQPLARHYLQGSKYDNVTTIRTSPDRFSERWWDRFLYGSQLAGAVGIWPWTDVFMSGETGNLLLATLSAGPVGVGDSLGSVDAKSLRRAVRQDSVIVKPDVPITPTDATVLADAQGIAAPMIASTYTDFGSVKAAYVFAHTRPGASRVAFAASSLGLSGQVYVYNYFRHAGRLTNATTEFSEELPAGFAYYIVAPVGRSGMALLGDAEQFVSMGRQRITDAIDDGTIHLTVAFASGEEHRTIQGYAARQPKVTAQTGTVRAVSSDANTQMFRFAVTAGGNGTAAVEISEN